MPLAHTPSLQASAGADRGDPADPWTGLATWLIQDEGFADVDTAVALLPPRRARRSGPAAPAWQRRARANHARPCRLRHRRGGT